MSLFQYNLRSSKWNYRYDFTFRVLSLENAKERSCTYLVERNLLSYDKILPSGGARGVNVQYSDMYRGWGGCFGKKCCLVYLYYIEGIGSKIQFSV